MNYRYTLKVESELDETVCELSCLTLEGVQEELLRKAESAISKYEDTKEKEQELANELNAENQHND